MARVLGRLPGTVFNCSLTRFYPCFCLSMGGRRGKAVQSDNPSILCQSLQKP